MATVGVNDSSLEANHRSSQLCWSERQQNQLRDCPIDNTLFKVNPEIRCSGVLSHYCSSENHAAGSKQI